jgi:hypothetical protein
MKNPRRVVPIAAQNAQRTKAVRRKAMQNSISTLRRTLMVVSFVAGWMILLASARSLSAQQQDASISGTVVDSHGLAVPGALVTATNQATEAARQVTADGAGHF